MTGSLTIVGSGIMMVGQITLEAEGYVKAADKVFYLLTDPVTEQWMREKNAAAESLKPLYFGRETRLDSYLAMTEAICEHARTGSDVTAVFYGHPGVFVFPSHAAVRTLKKEKVSVRMLPGISAEDCLFADVGFDPAAPGFQSFEATDFLVHHRLFDARSHLVLWQVGVVGSVYYENKYDTSIGVRMIVERLAENVPLDHMVVIYEASRFPTCPPRIEWVELGDLASSTLTPISTLYIPPSRESTPDLSAMAKLGIPEGYARRKEETLADPRFNPIPDQAN